MKKSPKPGDMNQRMHAVMAQATGLAKAPQKDPKAVERGRLGGQARAKALTPAQRKKAAVVAVGARKDRRKAAKKAAR